MYVLKMFICICLWTCIFLCEYFMPIFIHFVHFCCMVGGCLSRFVKDSLGHAGMGE